MTLAAIASVAALGFAAVQADPRTRQCDPVSGLEQLTAQPERRYLVIGESHGTRELPRFFGEIVCNLSQQRPVVVGLEMGHLYQPALDDFMQSDGSAAARARLLASAHWNVPDGRASEAMLDLLIRLRDLTEQGAELSIVPFMLPSPSPEERERLMAQTLIDAAEANPDTRVVALVGRIHAEREPLGGVMKMAAHLPPDQTLTLSYVPWEACLGAYGCGLPSREGGYHIVANAPPEWSWPRYDLWYTVGSRLHTSPNARPQE